MCRVYGLSGPPRDTDDEIVLASSIVGGVTVAPAVSESPGPDASDSDSKATVDPRSVRSIPYSREPVYDQPGHRCAVCAPPDVARAMLFAEDQRKASPHRFGSTQ